MSRVTRRGLYGYWTLEVEREMIDVTMLGSPYAFLTAGQARYRISGLWITREDANAIFSARQPYAASMSVSVHDSGLVRVDDIELTEAEAREILGGTDPLNVLLPAMYIRDLTTEELS
jgi:hypothetical protein